MINFKNHRLSLCMYKINFFKAEICKNSKILESRKLPASHSIPASASMYIVFIASRVGVVTLKR